MTDDLTAKIADALPCMPFCRQIQHKPDDLQHSEDCPAHYREKVREVVEAETAELRSALAEAREELEAARNTCFSAACRMQWERPHRKETGDGE